jgi:hypothetical protein
MITVVGKWLNILLFYWLHPHKENRHLQYITEEWKKKGKNALEVSILLATF